MRDARLYCRAWGLRDDLSGWLGQGLRPEPGNQQLKLVPFCQRRCLPAAVAARSTGCQHVALAALAAPAALAAALAALAAFALAAALASFTAAF